MEYIPHESWLHGKYENGEINTSLSYVAVNSPEFFAQGDAACDIIDEMHQYWVDNDVTQEEAFNNWINLYL